MASYDYGNGNGCGLWLWIEGMEDGGGVGTYLVAGSTWLAI